MAIKINPFEECVITMTLKRKDPVKGRVLAVARKIGEFDFFNSAVPVQQRYEQLRNYMSKEIDELEIKLQKEGR